MWLGFLVLLCTPTTSKAKPVAFRELLDVPQQQSRDWDWIGDAGTVERDCEFQIRVGMDGGRTPLLRLIIDGSIVDVDPKTKNPPTGPLLCRTPCSTKGPVLVGVASSVDYLWHYSVSKSSLNFYRPRLIFLLSDSLCRRSKLIILVETKHFSKFFLLIFYIFLFIF